MPKKKSLSPEAAKILERYRNAGKGIKTDENGDPVEVTEEAPRPNTHAPVNNPQMRRSGTRGK